MLAVCLFICVSVESWFVYPSNLYLAGAACRRLQLCVTPRHLEHWLRQAGCGQQPDRSRMLAVAHNANADYITYFPCCHRSRTAIRPRPHTLVVSVCRANVLSYLLSLLPQVADSDQAVAARAALAAAAAEAERLKEELRQSREAANASNSAVAIAQAQMSALEAGKVRIQKHERSVLYCNCIAVHAFVPH